VTTHAKTWRRAGLLLAAVLVAAPLVACSSDSGSSGSGSGGTLTLGYFPNLTHGSAIVGVQKGYFKDALDKDGATLKTQQFDSGSDTIDALLSGSLDATYIGPSPALTAYVQSHGAVRIISGATQGGAMLVVKPSITSIQDLKGKKIATPSAGNTQDIALKYFLKQNGFQESSDGTGDVTVVNQDNSVSVQTYGTGDIDGAWVPEPYASELVAQGAKVLVDEKTLWPQGKYVTTVLLVRKAFLDDHADLVDDLLTGQTEANDYIASNSQDAEKVVGDWLADYSGSPIDQSVLDSAWSHLTFSNDPVADSFVASAQHAADVGLLDPVDNPGGIFDLDPLNAILKDAGEPEVAGPSVQ
jgi:NitT/TauT family transport system substrate-binding protein